MVVHRFQSCNCVEQHDYGECSCRGLLVIMAGMCIHCSCTGKCGSQIKNHVGLCRYGSKCTRPKCTFAHKTDNGKSPLIQSDAIMSKISICRLEYELNGVDGTIKYYTRTGSCKCKFRHCLIDDTEREGEIEVHYGNKY